MRIRKTLPALALCAVTATSLVVAPATEAKGRHKGRSDTTCSVRHHKSQLTTDQSAAIAAACAQLKADLQAARSKFDDAVSAARAAVHQARDAAHAACSGGQGDTQACHDARVAAREARKQARADLRSARHQLKEDVTAARRAFEAAVKAAVAPPTTGGDTGNGGGDHGRPTGGGRCADLVSHAPADKQAALQAACDQLAADVRAAQTAYETARQSAQSAYLDATAALKAACGEGQGDTQACHDARTAFEQAVTQITSDLAAAETTRGNDLAAAIATFRSTLETVLGHPQGAGEPASG